MQGDDGGRKKGRGDGVEGWKVHVCVCLCDFIRVDACSLQCRALVELTSTIIICFILKVLNFLKYVSYELVGSSQNHVIDFISSMRSHLSRTVYSK